MSVTLRWKQAAAGRYAGQEESWDYSSNVAMVDAWIANGWCEIVGGKTKAKAHEAPPVDKAIKSQDTRRK